LVRCGNRWNNSVTTPTQIGEGTKTYYAQASDGTCFSSTRTAVTLTINPAPAAQSRTIKQYVQMELQLKL
jgi:hypothetical protein